MLRASIDGTLFLLQLSLCESLPQQAAIMAWRNQGITGSNNIPLGNRRRFGGDSTPASEDGYRPPMEGQKRGRSPDRGMYTRSQYLLQN